MSFFFYQNWHRERARLHHGYCSHCKDGSGTQLHDSGRNGSWHGPIDKRSVAASMLMSFGYADSACCPIRKP